MADVDFKPFTVAVAMVQRRVEFVEHADMATTPQEMALNHQRIKEYQRPKWRRLSSPEQTVEQAQGMAEDLFKELMEAQEMASSIRLRRRGHLAVNLVFVKSEPGIKTEVKEEVCDTDLGVACSTSAEPSQERVRELEIFMPLWMGKRGWLIDSGSTCDLIQATDVALLVQFTV